MKKHHIALFVTSLCFLPHLRAQDLGEAGLSVATTTSGGSTTFRVAAKLSAAEQAKLTAAGSLYALQLVANTGSSSVVFPEEPHLGLPGGKVYYAYTLTNDGAVAQSFSFSPQATGSLSLTGLAVYLDNAPYDGRADDENSPITATPLLQPGAQYHFVVRGNVPANATVSQTGGVTVTATSSVSGSQPKTFAGPFKVLGADGSFEAQTTYAGTFQAATVTLNELYDVTATGGPKVKRPLGAVTVGGTESGTARVKIQTIAKPVVNVFKVYLNAITPAGATDVKITSSRLVTRFFDSNSPVTPIGSITRLLPIQNGALVTDTTKVGFEGETVPCVTIKVPSPDDSTTPLPWLCAGLQLYVTYTYSLNGVPGSFEARFDSAIARANNADFSPTPSPLGFKNKIALSDVDTDTSNNGFTPKCTLWFDEMEESVQLQFNTYNLSGKPFVDVAYNGADGATSAIESIAPAENQDRWATTMVFSRRAELATGSGASSATWPAPTFTLGVVTDRDHPIYSEAVPVVAWYAKSSKPELNVFSASETPTLTFGGLGGRPAGTSITVTSTDWNGAEVSGGSLSESVSSTGSSWVKTMAGASAPGSYKPGYYKVSSRLSYTIVPATGNSIPVTSIIPESFTRPSGYITYAVVPDPETRQQYPIGDTFFGMQASVSSAIKFQPYLGVRWTNHQYYNWPTLASFKPSDSSPTPVFGAFPSSANDGSSVISYGSGKNWTTYRIAAGLYRMSPVRPLDELGNGKAAWERFCTDVGTAVAAQHPEEPVHVYEITWEPSPPVYSKSAEKMVEIYRSAYERIHQADPKAFILGPCEAHVRDYLYGDESYLRTDSKKNAPILDDLLECGLGNYIDGYSVHAYSGSAPFDPILSKPESPLGRVFYPRQDASVPLWEAIRETKRIMLAKLGRILPLYGTEQGLSTGEDVSKELDQARFLVRSNLIMMGEGFRMNLAFNLADYRVNGDAAGMGLFYNQASDGESMQFSTDKISPKPAAPAYATMTYLLEGKKAVGRVGRDAAGSIVKYSASRANDNLMGYAYENTQENGTITLVLWRYDDGEANSDVTLDVGSSATVSVYDWMGKQTRSAASGILTLPIGREPTYVVGVSPSLPLLAALRSQAEATSDNANSVFGVGASAVGIGNTVSANNAAVFGNDITNDIDNSLMIGTSDAAKITILQSGGVGIGTGTVANGNRLQVAGNAGVDGNLNVTGTVAVANNMLTVTSAGVGIGTNAPSTGTKLEVAGDTRISGKLGIGLGSGAIWNELDVNGAVRAREKLYVGIGNASKPPVISLEANTTTTGQNSTLAFSDQSMSCRYYMATFGGTNSTIPWMFFYQSKVGTTSQYSSVISCIPDALNSPSYALKLKDGLVTLTGDASTGRNMVVDGDVQIDGTLEVADGISTTSLTLPSGTWPDHVFEPDYKLQSLADVGRYVTEKKHLPGIPSAHDLAKTGVDVARMQASLLEKVEELTLHLVAQEKRIQALEAENARLRTQP